MGISRGRWEGDTLVVDVRNFNDQTWFDHAGNYHSEQLRVTERYTLTDSDHIVYEATVEDPVKLLRFRTFVNSDAPDPSVVSIRLRAQHRPAGPSRRRHRPGRGHDPAMPGH